jgi:hypothetical protein
VVIFQSAFGRGYWLFEGFWFGVEELGLVLERIGLPLKSAFDLKLFFQITDSALLVERSFDAFSAKSIV